MADENFEDELFADLYDDNDANKAAASAPESAAASAPASAANPPAQTEPAAGTQGNDDMEDDDDDDDVDFNLGGGSSNANQAAQAQQPAQAHDEDRGQEGEPAGAVQKQNKEEGKMFIGGLNWETTDQSLREYFEQYGEVTECTVMRDGATGRSRGFGFLTFKDAKTVNTVMVKEHFLDGKIIDPKRAIPRDEQEKTSKIFVGGVSQDTTDQEFREYFAQFGRVVDATLMMDKDTGRPRGFGFVTFESEAGVDACIDIPLEIHGKPVEVKRAQPRGNLQDDDNNKRNKFHKNDQQNMGGMGNSSMTPQAMAQHFQRMQQYFAMMQSQMAMRNMNPAMWQQMQQMQQMQMMAGRGGPGNNNGQMNPQMMQQMQQQQMMMMQQQQQQHGGGGDFNNGGGGGQGGNWDGMYDDGGYGGRGGGGGGGSGSNQGTPDPQNAPPANAPTGPKNAGRPGANYRGGGRGGNRGFHPYGR